MATTVLHVEASPRSPWGQPTVPSGFNLLPRTCPSSTKPLEAQRPARWALQPGPAGWLQSGRARQRSEVRGPRRRIRAGNEPDRPFEALRPPHRQRCPQNGATYPQGHAVPHRRDEGAGGSGNEASGGLHSAAAPGLRAVDRATLREHLRGNPANNGKGHSRLSPCPSILD